MFIVCTGAVAQAIKKKGGEDLQKQIQVQSEWFICFQKMGQFGLSAYCISVCKWDNIQQPVSVDLILYTGKISPPFYFRPLTLGRIQNWAN